MKARRFDFYPDDWLAGTIELSAIDRGVFITICALIYSRGSRIKTTLVAQHLEMHGNALNASINRLVQCGKIIRNGSEIGQKRSENELKTAQKRLRKAIENGRKGGRPSIKSMTYKKDEVSETGKLPSPSPSPSPSPEVREDANASSETRARRSGNGRKTRIAADWQPDSQDRGYAEARGWPWDRIDEQAAAFRDRCTRDEPRYADWHAAWRTWVRNADKFDARDSRAFNGSGSRQSRSGSIAEAARNVLSRLDLD